MTSEEQGDLVIRALMSLVRKAGGMVTFKESDLSDAGQMAFMLDEDERTVTVVVSRPDDLLQ